MKNFREAENGDLAIVTPVRRCSNSCFSIAYGYEFFYHIPLALGIATGCPCLIFVVASLPHMSISVTLEAGTNVAGLTKQGVRVHTIKKDLFEMGLSEAASPVGHTLRSYDMERTICDLVRSRRCIEAQTLQGAVKGYARSKTKNTPRLMRYAKALSIESVIRQYMEVLL